MCYCLFVSIPRILHYVSAWLKRKTKPWSQQTDVTQDCKQCFSAPGHPISLDPCLPRVVNWLGCAWQWGNEVHRLLMIISWSGMSLLLIMQISGAPRPSILCRCGPAAAPTDGKYTTPLGWIYCLFLAFGEAGADSTTRNRYSVRCKGAHTLWKFCTQETLYTAGPTALKLEIYPK